MSQGDITIAIIIVFVINTNTNIVIIINNNIVDSFVLTLSIMGVGVPCLSMNPNILQVGSLGHKPASTSSEEKKREAVDGRRGRTKRSSSRSSSRKGMS